MKTTSVSYFIGFGACLLVWTASAFLTSDAEAKGPEGLFFENTTAAGGFSVRKVRDTSNGVVCYVARGPSAQGHVKEAFSVGVSCLKE